jgi:hypothetical protein
MLEKTINSIHFSNIQKHTTTARKRNDLEIYPSCHRIIYQHFCIQLILSLKKFDHTFLDYSVNFFKLSIKKLSPTCLLKIFHQTYLFRLFLKTCFPCSLTDVNLG